AVQRLPAPGETVLGSGAVIAPGGKGANQAVAAARLGGAVRMIGCTGDDEFGRMARSALEAEGVDVGGVRAVEDSATGLALIMVDAAGENVITVAPGANGRVGDAEIAAALSAAPDVLVLSAEIPAGVLAAAGAAARELHGLGAWHAVVTAGSGGAALAGPAGDELIPGLVVHSVDSVGAGDAFVAALAVALAAGVPAGDAVRAAGAAGATATTRRGPQDALPRPPDILAATGVTWPVTA